MWQHISNTFRGFITWRWSLGSLIFLLLASIQGCAVTASFSPLKADRLYHSGRYEDLIRHIESTLPEQERRRILTENESRIAANESTTFELIKYHFKSQITIPLTFELIKFLKEYNIPLLVVLNKIDKISVFDKKRIISLFINTAKDYGLNLIHVNEKIDNDRSKTPYLEFSALKKTNLDKLKRTINTHLKN